jgi:cell division septal protein FtsQ
MPPQTPETPDPAQSRREWSDIQQSEHRRSTTDVARKRRWSHIGRWAALVILAVGLCGALVYASLSASKDSAALEPASSLSKITFRTDGVLDDKWLAQTLQVRHGMSMNSVDITRIRNLLLAQGQIRNAVVTLRLPNELVVEVRERMPLLRVQAQVQPGVVKTLLISGEGNIYEGANYPANTIRALPYVDGVTLRRQGNGYEPVSDIAPVAKLLNTTRIGWPKLYNDWYMVSLKRYKGSDSIVSLIDVTTHTTGTLVFSVDNMDDQLRRLVAVIRNGALSDPRQIAGINLSIPGQAVVDYVGTAQPPAKPAATSTKPVAKPPVSKQQTGTQSSKGR